jgi:hypothetical protein
MSSSTIFRYFTFYFVLDCCVLGSLSVGSNQHTAHSFQDISDDKLWRKTKSLMMAIVDSSARETINSFLHTQRYNYSNG